MAMQFTTNDQYQNLDRRVNELYRTYNLNVNVISTALKSIEQQLEQLNNRIIDLETRSMVNRIESVSEQPADPIPDSTEKELDFSLDILSEEFKL